MVEVFRGGRSTRHWTKGQMALRGPTLGLSQLDKGSDGQRQRETVEAMQVTTLCPQPQPQLKAALCIVQLLITRLQVWGAIDEKEFWQQLGGRIMEERLRLAKLNGRKRQSAVAQQPSILFFGGLTRRLSCCQQAPSASER
jgi:hypothetical protein